MTTEIENFLYRDLRVHRVLRIQLESHVVSLTLAPFSDAESGFDTSHLIDALFINSRVENIDSSYSDEADDSTLPWDIIGIDSKPVGDQFEFCLCTNVIEIIFVADWPTVKVAAS